MILTDKALKVLKNYNNINPGIVIVKSESRIRTKSEDNSIYSEAKVDDVFENDICLYNLGKFISAYEQMDKPELIVDENCIKLVKGKALLNFAFASPERINHPTKELNMGEPNISFDMDEVELGKFLRVGSTLALPTIKFYNKDDKVYMMLHDPHIRGSNNYNLEVASGSIPEDINFTAKVLTMLPSDYKVHLYDYHIGFDSEELEMKYIIGADDE